MSDDLAEGVLFYEGSAANGVRITDHVQEIGDRASFDAFVAGGGPEDHVLKVWGKGEWIWGGGRAEESGGGRGMP